MRTPTSVVAMALVLAMACGAMALGGTGCGGAFGSAPLVLTEVPNGPSGRAFIVEAARKGGCDPTTRSDGSLSIRCPEGELHVPTFEGPPTFAVRCVDARLSDVVHCRAVVRKMLLAGDPAASG